MQETSTVERKRERAPLNGVDTPVLFATINAVKAQPELAKFKFRATNQWVSGTHSRTTIESFTGAGGEHEHAGSFRYDADHPKVLVGNDNGPTPVEFLLHGLASCLTAGLANIAAARGVTLHQVRSTVSGDIDLNGILGLDPEVRNGYQQITVDMVVEGDASPEVLASLVEQSKQRSAVYDVITSSVPGAINVTTG